MSFKLRNVTFGYSDQPILRDLSLKLEAGIFHGILGPNGSGKTTLLDLLFRHSPPQSGTISYQGRNLQDLGRRDLGRTMALVPQVYNLSFPFQVREIVAMGRYPHTPRFAALSRQDWDMVDTVLKETGTWHLKDRFVTELSGGERQRVIFARALVQDTPVLLLDEATSNLDIKHGLSLMGLSRKRNRDQGTTVIAVFQDLNLAASFCDRFVFLRQGQVFAQGPVQEVLTSDNVARVFGVHSRVSYDRFAQCKQVIYRAP